MTSLPVQRIFYLLMLIVAFPFSIQRTFNAKSIDRLKAATAISCTPDLAALSASLEVQNVPILPGAGSYSWKIETNNDSAQLYFNQGINTYYGFHIIESLASFKKAAALDPDHPMTWWAVALALGPNINDIEYKAAPEAISAVNKALSLIDKTSPENQFLIRAMATRYSTDTSLKRETLNKAYTAAMKKAYSSFPTSADVLALYADAMMLEHPWDMWNVDGSAQPWTPTIQKVLEKALAISPNHPGANHYYIHVIEPSPYPEKAKMSADRLGALHPGLAHLVHMPSHIYLRTGEFKKGAAINQQALTSYATYSKLLPEVANGAFIYYMHNQHMLANCAMHAGQYQTSVNAALQLQQFLDSATLYSPPPIGSLVQYLYMSPVLINVRFERWDSLLAMARPDNRLVYANIMYHFGKGFAYASTKNISLAKHHLDSLSSLTANKDLALPLSPFSSALEGSITATEMLAGIIALNENKVPEAIKHLTKAAETERKMVYNEPRDWFLNPNQYLGTAYLKNKNYNKAEESFKKDLGMNANNIWSLRGLREVYKHQDKTKLSGITLTFKEYSEGADIAFDNLLY